MDIRGGGKKSKSWNLIRLTSLSHSLCSTDSKNIKMSSEDPWEVLALKGQISDQNEAKIQRNRPKFQSQFWLPNNLLPDVVFSIPYWRIIIIINRTVNKIISKNAQLFWAHRLLGWLLTEPGPAAPLSEVSLYLVITLHFQVCVGWPGENIGLFPCH